MTAQPAAPRPAVSLRGRSAAVRLDGEVLLFEQDGTVSRIPLEAVETVRAGGADGRSVEIVLTSAGASQPTVYRLNARGSEASVTTFTEVVNRALPHRHASVRRNGDELVQTTSGAAPRRQIKRWQLVGGGLLLVLYLPVLVALFAMGETALAGMWAISIGFLGAGAFLVSIPVRQLYDHWVLRRRGIQVAATHSRTVYSEFGEGRPTRYFVFTDAEGNTHEIPHTGGKAISRDPDRIEVIYDPLEPGRVLSPLDANGLVAYAVTGIPGILLLIFSVALGPYEFIEFLLS